MIHFFPLFSRNAEDTPFGQTLRAPGVEHRIFAANQSQNYRHRWALLFIGYPRLAWTALSGAIRSLTSASPSAPDAAVISSDVEALVFTLVRLLPFAAKARLVFMPFIFTQRASPALNRLRLAYYRIVMWRVDLAICHSSLEVE